MRRKTKGIMAMNRFDSGWRATGFLLTLAASAGAWQPAIAQQAGLEGSWSGGGRMMLSSGNSERATCRASFRRQSATSFGVSAVCATPSARVAQSAVVQRVGANQYAGQFYNKEFDVSGTIHMTAHGNRLSVSLRGGGAAGDLDLRR